MAVMRPRASHLLLLLVGFMVSVAVLAIVLPKLAHFAPASTPPAAGPTTATSAATRPAAHGHHGWLTFGHILLIFGLSAALGAVGCARWALGIVRERLENRLTRDYGLFELRLSLHDEAREQEAVDMVESLLHAVREFPEDRARYGQPFVAFEAHYGRGSTGELEWLLCVRCERGLAETIDGIVAGAYPDVRLGYDFTGPPQEIDGVIPQPGHVLRFRKARSFVYPIVGDVERGAARALEAIAQVQAAVGVPSCVRFQLTPCALTVERYARSRLRAHEDRLAVGDGGVLSSLNRAEMTAAAESQAHAWCWLEVQIACESRETANRIAAAVLARRGQNRLQRRWMILREDLYRRRFPTAYPPLLPGAALRTLASSSEVAKLIALPGARMKNVPVRRRSLPRIPAPPELGMATGDPEPQMPPGSQTADRETP
jgi:hypothetical protein